jgi:Tfp pilus assembly protein PilF
MRHRDWGLALALVALTAALFWPARGFAYLNLDDDVYVRDNPLVAGGLNPEAVRQAFTTVHENWWLPLLWISYLADVVLFGRGPQGHHLMNVLLHAANAGLLFWTLRRLTGSRWRSFFVAALFAWHPLRVESVAWIAARKDVLSGLFFLLALGVYARQAQRPSAGRLAAVGALMLGGLMAKAILVVLPPILLVLDGWPLRRAGDPRENGAWRAWRPLLAEKLPLFGVAAVFSLLNLGTHRVDVAGAYLSWPVRLGLIAPNYATYLGKIFWPANLSILYPENDVANWPVALAALVGLAAVTGALVRWRRQAPYALAGWLWFLVALVPVIRGVRLGLAGHANRFVYLPSIGLAIAVVWGVAALAERGRWRRGAIALGVGTLALLAWGTARELPHWRNSGTVFGRALELPPAHPAALLNYGVFRFSEGELDEAERCFLDVLALMPDDSQTLGNVGQIRVLQGRAAEARAILAPAVGRPDAHWLTTGSWGMLLLQEGRAAEALPYFRKTLAQRPQELGMRMEWLRACWEAGAEAEARRQAALVGGRTGVAPAAYAALFSHYLQWWRFGGRAYAWGYFRRLAERNPDDVALLNNVAWLAATDPETPPDVAAQAVALAERAVAATQGRDASILDTLGAARAATGDFIGAAAAAEQALALETDAAAAEKIRARWRTYRERLPAGAAAAQPGGRAAE